VDNYRAITLSKSISKILESLLFDFVVNTDDIDVYQFGFQKGVPQPCVLVPLKVQLNITG